jgi:hypothetical protein
MLIRIHGGLKCGCIIIVADAGDANNLFCFGIDETGVQLLCFIANLRRVVWPWIEDDGL